MLVPTEIKQRIERELGSIQSIQGKVTLTCEFNFGSGGTLSSFKLKTYTEEEVRV
jgi:hypothetical protein